MKPKKNLTYKMFIKFTEEDRLKADLLRERGINITQLFRYALRNEYEKMIKEK